MAPLIAKPFGDVIWRFSAETMPALALRSRPNGVPIATTPAPPPSPAEAPRGRGTGAQAGPRGGHRRAQERDVGGVVEADPLRRHLVVVRERDGHGPAIGDHVGVRDDV